MQTIPMRLLLSLCVRASWGADVSARFGQNALFDRYVTVPILFKGAMLLTADDVLTEPRTVPVHAKV